MYVLMFIAAVKLRRNQPEHPRGYKAPGLVAWSWVGGLASIAAILIGFVPPSQFGQSSPVVYGVLVLVGILVIGVVPPLLLYRLRKPSWKAAVPADTNGASAAAPAPASSAEPAPASARAGTPAVVPVPRAGPAPTATGPSNGQPSFQAAASRRHRANAWAVGAVLVVLAAVGVAIYKQGQNDGLARDRAAQVVALFRSHDLPTPVDRKTVIDVLGSTGGPVCADPGGSLSKALKDQSLNNGAATVGSRPIRADRLVVEGEDLVIQVYCPTNLPAYRAYIDAKGYYPVIRR